MTDPRTADPELSAPVDAPIVVGVDGSQLSLTAVRLAAREAALHARPLRVVHAFNWFAEPSAPADQEPRLTAERLTDLAVATAVEAEPDIVVTDALVEGPAITTLLRESGSAALVVLGDGGLAECTCVPIDTTSVQVAARAGCSVLVARELPPPAGPVLVGMDGSPSSPNTLDFAFDAAARRAADLIVMWAWDPDEKGGTQAEAIDRLADAVAPWQQKYPSVSVQQRVRIGNAKTTLVEESRTAELVVVGGRGEQPWHGMLGAVSQAVLHHSPAPVAIVRSPHGLYVQI